MRWTTAATDWLLSRSPRERWLLGVMFAIALPLLAYLLIYAPLMTRLDVAKARHVEAVRRHGAITAQLQQLDAVTLPRTEVSTVPLALRITDAAARAGVRLTGNEAQGSAGVVITVAPAPPGATLRWLRQLEASGVRVRQLALTPQGAGGASVTATLVDGAAP